MALDDKILQYKDGLYYEYLDSIYCGEGNSYYLCRDINTLKCMLIYPADIIYVIDDRTHYIVQKDGKTIINRNDADTLYKMLPNKVYMEKVTITKELIGFLEQTYGFDINESIWLNKGGIDGDAIELDTYDLLEQLHIGYSNYKKGRN